jgi:hypothetical protein
MVRASSLNDDGTLRRLASEFAIEWDRYKEVNALTDEDATTGSVVREEIEAVAPGVLRVALWGAWFDILLRSRSVMLATTGGTQSNLARSSVRLTKIQLWLREHHGVSTRPPPWMLEQARSLLGSLGVSAHHLDRMT